MESNTPAINATALDQAALAAIEGTALAAVLRELKDTGDRLIMRPSNTPGAGAHMASLRPAGRHMASLSRHTK